MEAPGTIHLILLRWQSPARSLVEHLYAEPPRRLELRVIVLQL